MAQKHGRALLARRVPILDSSWVDRLCGAVIVHCLMRSDLTGIPVSHPIVNKLSPPPPLPTPAHTRTYTCTHDHPQFALNPPVVSLSAAQKPLCTHWRVV